MKSFEQVLSKLNHHIAGRVNSITSYLSFLSSIPIIQSLSSSNRFYLCKHNVRSLICLNLHEIEQTCFSEPWQVEYSLVFSIFYSFYFFS
jgi:Fe2+ or Zn2+ uptake regulation protein